MAHILIPPLQPHYPVVCSWCQAEDKRTVVDYSVVKGSHGICEKHSRELLGEEGGDVTKTFIDGFEQGSSKETHVLNAEGDVYHAEFGNVTGPAGAVMWWRHEMPSPDVPEHALGQPEYKHIEFPVSMNDEERIRSGSKAAMLFTMWRPHDAGWRWRYPVRKGERVRARIYAHAWHSQCSQKPHDGPIEEDCRTSIHWAHMYFSVGLDPTGGLDPWADTVRWGERVERYGTYGKPVRSPSIEAEGEHVTIFFRSQATHPLKHCDCYIDDLEVLVEPVQDAEGTVPPAYDYAQRYTGLPQIHDEWEAIRWRRAVATAKARAQGSISHSLDDLGSGPACRVADLVNPTDAEIEYLEKHYPGLIINVIQAKTEVEAACRLFDPLGESADIALSQNDARWKDRDLGEAPGGETIGQAGCLLTLAAIALRHVLATDVTPDKLNLLLASHGGPFVQDDLLMWETFADLFDCFDERIRHNNRVTEGDLGLLLYNGWEIGLRRADGKHFVYLETVHDGLYIIDPWDGKRKKWRVDQVRGIRAAHVKGEEPVPIDPPVVNPPDPVERKPLIVPHLQTIIPNVLADYVAPMAARGTPLPWVKIFNAGDAELIKRVSPHTKILYRRWIPDQGQFLRELEPSVWHYDVDGLIAYLRPELVRYGQWIDAVESLNEETPTHNLPKLEAISRMDADFCRKLYEADLGVRPAVGAAGVGNPDHGAETELMCKILGPAMKDTHAVAVPHAYTPAKPGRQWLCDKDYDVRPAYSWNDTFMRLGFEGIPIVVGEMGPIGALGEPHPLLSLDGWRSSQCIDGDEDLLVRMSFDLQDECWEYNGYVGYNAIQALCPFTSGIGIGWHKFLWWDTQYRRILAEYEARGI